MEGYCVEGGRWNQGGGEGPSVAPNLADSGGAMAPSDLPPPILVSHSMTDGIAAYAGELEGLKWNI